MKRLLCRQAAAGLRLAVSGSAPLPLRLFDAWHHLAGAAVDCQSLNHHVETVRIVGMGSSVLSCRPLQCNVSCVQLLLGRTEATEAHMTLLILACRSLSPSTQNQQELLCFQPGDHPFIACLCRVCSAQQKLLYSWLENVFGCLLIVGCSLQTRRLSLSEKGQCQPCQQHRQPSQGNTMFSCCTQCSHYVMNNVGWRQPACYGPALCMGADPSHALTGVKNVNELLQIPLQGSCC